MALLEIDDLHLSMKSFDGEAKVLILTGQTTGAQQHEALRLGAAEILRKPFELEEVLRAIRAVYMRRGSPVVRLGCPYQPVFLGGPAARPPEPPAAAIHYP